MWWFCKRIGIAKQPAWFFYEAGFFLLKERWATNKSQILSYSRVFQEIKTSSEAKKIRSSGHVESVPSQVVECLLAFKKIICEFCFIYNIRLWGYVFASHPFSGEHFHDNLDSATTIFNVSSSLQCLTKKVNKKKSYERTHWERMMLKISCFI